MRSLLLLLATLAAPALAQPARVPFSGESLPIPGNQAGDTAILPDRFERTRDLIFGTDAVNNGFYGFLADGGSGLSTGFGAVGGVDAVPSLRGFPGTTTGLVAASATNAGSILFFTKLADGGLGPAGPNLPVVGPRAIALADFGDAGAHLFYDTGTNRLQHARLVDDGGVVLAIADAPIPLPFFARAIAVSQQRRKVYASAGFGGVFEIDVLASTPTAVQIIDAGTPLDIAGGLAVYPQRDGGALLVAALQAQDLVRVFRLGTGPAEPLGDFVITGPDGGRAVRGAEFIDVWPGGFGGPPDGGALFPKGLLVICDRQNLAGANYKFVRWDDFARSATPALPIDVPGDEPVNVPATTALVSIGLTVPAPSRSIVEVAWWPGPDRLSATTDGVSVRSAASGAVDRQLELDGGLALGVAALDGFERLGTGPLLAATTMADGGTLTLFSLLPDGGSTQVLALATQASEPVLFAELKDAGAMVFTSTGAALQRWPLTLSDAGVLLAGARVDLALPETPRALALLDTSGQLAFTAGSAIFTVDPLGAGQATRVVDAGASVMGLATYEQADGGAMLLVALPALGRFRVYGTHGSRFPLLAEFALVNPDGGPILPNAAWVDVTATPMGRSDGGAPRWPVGVVAVGASSQDGGAIYLVDWGDIARAATPPLPIDAPSAAAGGSAGGNAGGGGGSTGGGFTARAGGRATGGGGGDIVEPPKGCCNGAPTDFVVPALAFLVWTARFRARRQR